MMPQPTNTDGRRTVLRDDNIAKKLKSQFHKIPISRPDSPPPPHDSPPSPKPYPPPPPPEYVPETTDSTLLTA